jgi:hypothetical protein
MITTFSEFIIGFLCGVVGISILLYIGCTLGYWLLENTAGNKSISLWELLQSQWNAIKNLRIF